MGPQSGVNSHPGESVLGNDWGIFWNLHMVGRKSIGSKWKPIMKNPTVLHRVGTGSEMRKQAALTKFNGALILPSCQISEQDCASQLFNSR